MKNVLVVSQFMAPNAGNYIATMLDLKDYMAKRQIRCFFAFPNEAENCYWIKNFNSEDLLFLPLPKLGKFKSNPKVLELIEAFAILKQIDIIHSNFDGYDLACGKITRKLKIPFIISFHNPIVKQKNLLKNIYQNIMLQYHYRIASRNAEILFVSEEISEFRKRFGIKKYGVLNNGISLRRFSPKNPQRSLNTHLLMLAGVRFQVKGADRLLKFMQENDDPNVTVDVVSEGVTTERIEALGDSRIRAITGSTNMDSLFDNYDGFISLARYETFSYAIAEAMYKGLPIIKSDCHGTNWANGNPSVFVVKNSDEFWSAVQKVRTVENDALRVSSEFIRENYGNDVWCEKLYRIYLNNLKQQG